MLPQNQDGRDEDYDPQSDDSAPPYNLVPPALHNVVIFGESGAGKSSLLNMVLGYQAAQIPSGAGGCTFNGTGHNHFIDGTLFRIHDMAGLDEGEEGQVPKLDAIMKLYSLLQSLESGISLLIFCIRAPRIKNAKNNWTLFYDIICQRRVPIAVVVTGLENEEDMDKWWDDNRDTFRQYDMLPAAHACITATPGKLRQSGKYTFQEEYDESKAKVETMIKSYYKLKPWRMEKIEWLGKILYETTLLPRCCGLWKPKEVKKVVGEVKGAIHELVANCGMPEEEAKKLGEMLANLP